MSLVIERQLTIPAGIVADSSDGPAPTRHCSTSLAISRNSA
jgi:hypothetical protein